jgi:hypothetical protein
MMDAKMRMQLIIKSALMLNILAGFCFSTFAKKMDVFCNVDTLLMRVKIGFDFITQKACTTYDNYPGCHTHFFFHDFHDPELHYDLRVDGGYGIKMGKLNLDSMKSAPPDSVFNKQPFGKIDSIPPESLFSRVGNCYWIKTGIDPRVECSLHAKIKILGFKVIDSASRKIEMRFLYAYNDQGIKNVATSGLDTFHLGGTNTKQIKRSRFNAELRKQHVFTFVGDGFTVPMEFRASGTIFSVYDLTGKRLERAVIGAQILKGVPGSQKVKGILVGKVEK